MGVLPFNYSRDYDNEKINNLEKLRLTVIPIDDRKDIEPLINEFTDLFMQRCALRDQKTAHQKDMKKRSYYTEGDLRKRCELGERMTAKTRELDACLKKFADIELVLPGNEEDVP